MTTPTDGTEPVLELTGRLRLRGTQAPLDLVPRRRGPRRSVREGEEAHPAHRRARRLRAHQLRARFESPPLNIIVLPVLFEGSVRAVVELASFSPFSVTHQAFLDQLTESIGLVLNTIEASTLTREPAASSRSRWPKSSASQQEELTRVERRPRAPGPAARRAERRGRADATRRSSSRSCSSRRRPASSRSRRSTSRSSSRTCRTSSARRSTVC